MRASGCSAFALAAASLGLVAVRADSHLRGVTNATTTTTTAAATTADSLAVPPSPAPAPTAAVRAVAAPAPERVVAEPTAGVPGGWGEPADFAAAVRAGEAENVTLKAQWSDFDGDGYGDGWGRSGSCAAYGCINYYAPWHDCQCNTDCSKYDSCCKDYSHYCHPQQQPTPAPHHQHHAPSPSHKRNVMTLYHQTDQHAASLIQQHGFRPGKSGWCGGAIYFATSPQATYTKAIGPDSHKGAMLECQVDVGRVLHQDRRCGGHAHNRAELNRLGYDSIVFNPGDGDEHVIWDKTKVLSIKQIPI